jgi:hypothetical protein
MEGGRTSPDPKEFHMRLYTRIMRLALLASLAVTTVVCGGWKWENFPH